MVAKSDELNDAWSRGYKDGYAEYCGTVPTIPARPETYPAGAEPVDYFYKKGRLAGQMEGMKRAAGIKQ